MDVTSLTILIILVLCVLGLSWFSGTDAPYVPTKYEDLKNLLKKAGVKKDKIFYELGSGDGRVVMEAAKLGATSFGIEQSWLRVLYSRFKAKKLNLSNAHFIHGNIFDRDYFPADFIFIYLLLEAVGKLEKKLKYELKPGSIVITQTYHFKNWKPFAKVDQFFLYKA